MPLQSIKITSLFEKITSKPKEARFYTICWFQEGVKQIQINTQVYRHIRNSLFFLGPEIAWKIHKADTIGACGYILTLPEEILALPRFKPLLITQLQYFKTIDEVPKIKLSPGIEKRIQVIIEMLDELLSTQLNNREEAILSLLHTLFVYCDGQCNIKTPIAENNQQTALVYKFKQTLDQQYTQNHQVQAYADCLHVSSKYLNACVQKVLGRNAKHLIEEKLIMSARHLLKFSDYPIKEIAFRLGFSSPDYFSYFLKKHTQRSPSQTRKL